MLLFLTVNHELLPTDLFSKIAQNLPYPFTSQPQSYIINHSPIDLHCFTNGCSIYVCALNTDVDLLTLSTGVCLVYDGSLSSL